MDTRLFGLFGADITVGAILIPVFAGVIGYGTNWVAIKMMFLPIDFWGVKMPFTLKGIPVIGWQGIIPSKAAKMGSITVDTGLSKLGTMSEFYQALEPEVLAAHIVKSSRDEMHQLIDDIIQEEYPDLWRQLPGPVKQAVHQRIESEMPDIIKQVMNEIGDHIDRLVDLKLMVIRFLEANPRLINQIFLEVGAKEFRFVINSGAWLGFLLGFGPMAVYLFTGVPDLIAVPVGAALVGYLTNWIALKVIFEPLDPKKIGPFTFFGIFLKRQAEVSIVFSNIIAQKVLTMNNIVRTMFNGPDGDRTQRLIADSLRPVVERNVGVARPLVRVAAGTSYDSIQENIAAGAVGTTVEALTDESFVTERQQKLSDLMASRMRVLPSREFAAMLRSAFEQDEWILIAVGAFLGFAAGVVQVFVTLGGG
ncbi:MAG: hypothetical protein GEU86_14685 [Actinophytocola sp.]|nr:hypothetical protein [Actinophytocola sp.]